METFLKCFIVLMSIWLTVSVYQILISHQYNVGSFTSKNTIETLESNNSSKNKGKHSFVMPNKIKTLKGRKPDFSENQFNSNSRLNKANHIDASTDSAQLRGVEMLNEKLNRLKNDEKYEFNSLAEFLEQIKTGNLRHYTDSQFRYLLNRAENPKEMAEAILNSIRSLPDSEEEKNRFLEYLSETSISDQDFESLLRSDQSLHPDETTEENSEI